MNEKINPDLNSLKFIFSKNKPYILPIIIMLVSLILFFQFVIPQFRALNVTRKEALDASAKLEALKTNLDILTNINGETLDSQFRILTLALPLNKDFIGILNSVRSTAQKTGANLGSFSFSVGDISKFENGDNFPVVKLSIPINAEIAVMNNFIEIIGKTVPLSDVYSVKVGEVSSMVNLSFYYKPLDTSNYSQDVRISPISQKGLALINQLSEYGNTPSFSGPSIPIATSSGQ